MKHNIPKLKLETGRIDLWFSFSDEINDPGLLSAYENYLSISEKQKMKRFHFHKHRHQFLITRALVRTTLSRYFDINPELWRFSNNEYEKPEVVLTGEMPPIRFNISHTEGLVACAVALEEDIGVDVEYTTKQNISVDIADKYFSLQEASDLYSVPEAERKQRFFSYWTLKESFVKAVGKGLSIPLDEFSFHLKEEDQPIRISFSGNQSHQPNNWQFWIIKPSQHHTSAITIHKKKDVNFRLSVKKVVPLIGELPLNYRIIKQSFPILCY